MLISHLATLLNLLISSNILRLCITYWNITIFLMKLHCWDNIVKGKDFFPFEYGLNHQMTSDNEVPINSIRKVYWAQLDAKIPCLKFPPASSVLQTAMSPDMVNYTWLIFVITPHMKLLRIWNTAATGVVARRGVYTLSCNGPVQVNRRSVTKRPHTCSSKVDSKQSSKSFMIIQFLFQLPRRSRGKLWGFDGF